MSVTVPTHEQLADQLMTSGYGRRSAMGRDEVLAQLRENYPAASDRLLLWAWLNDNNSFV